MRDEQGQTALIVAATVFPYPGGPTRQTLTAGASGAALAGAEDFAFDRSTPSQG